MSPLWGDRLLVSLAAGELCWLRLGGVRRRGVIDKQTVRVDPRYGAEPWEGALAALRAAAEAWRKDAVSVSVILSNHFVRYALVPQSDGVHGAEEEIALARYHFAKLHGEPSRAWDVRLSEPAADGPRIACAIDAGLLRSLRECFPRDARPRLISVQPYFAAALNAWRAQFPGSGAWLLLVELERACLALFTGRSWISVQNARGEFPDAEAWAQLIDRERWRIGAEDVPDTVLVHARGSAGPLPRHDRWKFQALQPAWPKGLTPLDDLAYATALTAA